MRSLKNYKYLKASSLLESVIAIAIISVCILVAFSIYLNVVKQNRSIGFYNAKHKVEAITQDVLMNKDYEDNSFKFKGFTIDKKVEKDIKNNTLILNFTIVSSNKSFTLKKIIPYVAK